MICARCGEEIPRGEECLLHGQQLCEDCYIGAVQPPKTCDVAAVYAAKKHRQAAGQTGTEGLTDLQKKIYFFVREKGKVTREALAEQLGLPSWELEKQFAVLRHCELLKARKEGDTIYLVPFDS